MAYQMGQDGKPLLSGEYLAAVGRGEIQDSRVGGFTPGAGTLLGRNDQGQLATNAMRIGGGSAARKPAGVIASAVPASTLGGVQNTAAPVAAPPKPPASTAPANAGNWGGIQNTPNGQNTQPAFPAPTASGGKLGDMNTMQQHWNQYWSNFAAGSKVPFAGGELTRNADGSATFKSAAGQSYTYTKDTPFSDLASRFPEIAAVWKNDFGYGAAPAPGSTPGQSPGTTPGNAPGQPPSGSGATQTEVTPEMSVEERAAAIAATDSPLMQQARGRAMQQMNERGLINSSLGIQAGQEAVLERATDIAKADAQTEFQNSQNNANRNLNWQTAQLQAQTSLQNAQLSAQTQLSVAEINRQYSQMANLSSTSASLLTAFNNDVNGIVLSDLPAEAKEAAISARTQTLRLSMNVMGSINGDVDMNTLLNQILG